MISKHAAYEAAHDDYGALARYIADAGHDGEKCLVSWCAGCAADDDYELAVVEAQAAQAMNNRVSRLEMEATREQRREESLKVHGMGIKPHGNGLVIKDSHGEHAVKASAVDRALSAKRLHERFGPFQPYRSLGQIQERSRYEAAPLQRSPERGKLFAEYRHGIEIRKARLTDIKERENATLAAIRATWAAKRREIERIGIAKRNRRNLLALARKHEKEDLAKAKLALLPEREAVRREIPYTSWQDFLKLEAGNGNEVALAVLRSRKEAVEPETAPEPERTPTPPKKDWSRHGLDYATKTATRAEYVEKERELQERSDLSGRGKKQLQAYLRMEQIAAEARAEGVELGGIKRRIDGKGVVIFTLDSGGTVRDTGKDIFYSVHDSQAERATMLYAAKKWGKRIAVKKGRIIFQPEREMERPEPEPELSRHKQGLSWI